MSEFDVYGDGTANLGAPADGVAEFQPSTELKIGPPLTHEAALHLAAGHLVSALEFQLEGFTVPPDNRILRLHYPVNDALTLVTPLRGGGDAWPPSAVALSDMSRGYRDRQRLFGVRQMLVIDLADSKVVSAATQHNLQMPPVPSSIPIDPLNITDWGNIVRGSNVISIDDYRAKLGK